MHKLLEEEIYCPYCGEVMGVLIEPLQEEQYYIEDCQVCCCPIEFTISEDQDGQLKIAVGTTNE